MRIQKSDTFVVQVDNQSRLYPMINGNELLLENQKKLIKGMLSLDVPIINTQQYTKGLGDTIPELKELFTDFHYIEKMSFSCCDDEEFMTKAKSMNKKNVVLFGIESHVCVLQTAIDFKGIGFNPIVITNCVSSRYPEDKKIAIKRLRDEGIVLSTYESILFELLRYSNIPEFKPISKIVK